MRIRFVLLNADAGSGIVRATFESAGWLADSHDVDIVSVVRRRDEPLLPLDPRVTLRRLVDLRRPAQSKPAPGARVLARGSSRLAHPDDLRSRRYFTLLSDLRLARAIRDIRQGVVIGTRASINLAIARFARPSVYAVAQDHQHLQLWSAELRQELASLYPRLDAVVTLTPGDAASYRALLPAGVDVRDIPNAIPEADLPLATGDAKVVVAAGRLARQKGFDLLVAAFELVHRVHPDWRLHVFGEGADRPVVEAAIRDRGLSDTVVLRGFAESLRAELATAGSIFALSSRYEGYPIVLLEAMSVGLPPVAFDCPTGPADIIADGTSGILVAARDVAGMAKAINALIEDPERRVRMAAAARAAARRFTAPEVLPRWSGLLDELASRPPGQRRSAVLLPGLRQYRR